MAGSDGGGYRKRWEWAADIEVSPPDGRQQSRLGIMAPTTPAVRVLII